MEVLLFLDIALIKNVTWLRYMSLQTCFIFNITFLRKPGVTYNQALVFGDYNVKIL